MAILPCDWCGKFGHAYFACPDPKKPAGWKPDRLKGVKPPIPTKTIVKPSGIEREFKVTPQELADNFGVILAKDEPPPTEVYAGKRGRGRPKTIDDMRAYKAKKERERRAAKAAKESK